jgi:3',5'-cyclic AMP phosphodiesterase CpdA
MNKLILIASIVLASSNLFAQNPSFFKSEVETDLKPWTHLNFYNDPDNFQFAIVTDRNGGNRPGIFADAVSKINILYPEFVLSVGDLINGYTRDTAQIKYEWNEVNQIIDELKMPFFYLPGNHDITNQVMAKEWEKRYGRRYYDFTYKNTLFIILDSNDDDDYSLTREQTDFAIESIRQHPDVRWTFVLMHHPIWTYNTDGRFEELESALSDRKATILAGHTHHYNHEHRKGQNYYVLATTGAGSNLRGNYFGEFDHITWVTMTDAGPSLANLRLDGILPHDIANKETQLLAAALAKNASFEHVLLCNQGEKFSDGTLYLHFENSGVEPMNIKLQFYHQHQLIIPEPITNVTLNPGEKRIVEIPFSSPAPIAYNEVEAIQIDWQMEYELPEYPNFNLSGSYNLEVAPSQTSLITPQIPKFLNELTVSAVHPYSMIKTVFETNHMKGFDGAVSGVDEIEIEESGEVGIKLMNDKKQYTAMESRKFEKTSKLHKAVKVKDPKEGLKYNYYEGTWDKMPDFDQLKAISNGVAKDFWVADYTLREDHYGMVFTGNILVQEDGLYIFNSRSDDACKLFIDDELVVNQDGAQEDYKDVGAIALKKGFHPVSIHFMEAIGRERLRLYFKRTYDIQWEELEVKGRFYH